MKGYELYYTSCEKGIEEKSGFQIKAINKNITETEKAEIIKYGATDSLKFVYKKLASNRYCFIKSFYVGKDFTKRDGNYFEDAVIIDDFDFKPICMFDWDGWKDNFDGIGYLDDVEIDIDCNLSLNKDIEIVSLLIRSMLVTKKYNRKIVIKDVNVEKWIKNLSIFFDVEFLKHFSFSTNEEYDVDLDIIGIDEESDVEIDYNTINYQYLVLDIINNQFSKVDEYQFYSKYIIELYKNNKLDEFFEFCKDFNVDTYEYENILKFFYMLNFDMKFDEDEIISILDFIFKNSNIDISTYVNKLLELENEKIILFLIGLLDKYPYMKKSIFSKIKHRVYKKFIHSYNIEITPILLTLKENEIFEEFKEFLFNDFKLFLKTPMNNIEQFIDIFNPNIDIKISLVKIYLQKNIDLELYKYVGIDKFLELCELVNLDDNLIKKIANRFYNENLHLNQLNKKLREEIIKYRIQNSNNPIEEFFKYTENVDNKKFFQIAFEYASQSQKIDSLLQFCLKDYSFYLEKEDFIKYLKSACDIISLENLYKYQMDNYIDESDCAKIYLIKVLRSNKIELDVNRIFLNKKDLEWFIKSYLMIINNCDDMKKLVNFWITQRGEIKEIIFEKLDFSKCKNELEDIEGIEEYMTIEKNYAKKIFKKITSLFKGN